MSRETPTRREHRATLYHTAGRNLETFRDWCDGMAEDTTQTPGDRDLWATLAQLIADHLERRT